MKIKFILSYVQYVGVISYLVTTMQPIHAAPFKIEPIPIIQGSIDHPGLTWIGINKDFNAGLQLLINQQFSVWSTGGKEYISLGLPTQYIWAQEKKTKEKKKQNKSTKSPPVHARECHLQELSLSSVHFGLGGRIMATPQWLVGVHYFLVQPACLNQANLYNHQIEVLENKHSLGIELMNPLIQYHLSGYWKNTRAAKQHKKHTSLEHIQHFTPSQSKSADSADFSQLLADAAEHYTAHEVLMFDQWGVTTKLSYIYRPSLKGFGSAHYMRFPDERYDCADVGVSFGVEYTPQRFFTVVPKIKWSSTQGLQVACAMHLEWRANNTNTHYKKANDYLTQPLPREQIPFVFKEDFYYKRLNNYRSQIQRDPNAGEFSKQIEAEYYIGKILCSRFPGMRYAPSEMLLDKTQSALAQHERNVYAQFPTYIMALPDNTREVLNGFMKALFNQRHLPSVDEHLLTPAPPTENNSIVQFDDSQYQSRKTASINSGKTSHRRDSGTSSRKVKYYHLQEGDIYYASREGIIITFVVKSLQASKSSSLIPTFIGTDANGLSYKLCNNQLINAQTNAVVKQYNIKQGDGKIHKIKLSPNLDTEGNPGKVDRIVFDNKGRAILEQ